MGDDVIIKINGMSALASELQALKGRLNRSVQDATTKTGERLRHNSILHFHGSHAPGRWHVGGSAPNIVSGNLAWSIVAPPSVNIGTGRFTTRVAPTAIYSRVIEFGAPAGYIKPIDAKYLSWFDTQYGVRRYRKTVDIPPHPFFRPARDEMPPQMRQIFVSNIGRALVI